MDKETFKYQVFKGTVPQGQVDNIKQLVLSPSFAWYLSNSAQNRTVTSDVFAAFKDTCDVFEAAQLCHVVYNDTEGTLSHFKGIADYLLEQLIATSGLVVESVLRIKFNLQLKVGVVKGEFNTPHTDFSVPHFVAIYYVNTSDSCTTLFKQKVGDDLAVLEPMVKIESEEGVFVLFDGLHYHAGMHPKIADSRVVINFCILGHLP